MDSKWGLWPVGPLGTAGCCGGPTTYGQGMTIDWDQVNEAITTVAPGIIGVASDLVQQRKQTLTGLQNQRAKLQKKLDKSSNPYDQANLRDQIATLDMQIAQLQLALASDAPPSALDDALANSTPDYNLTPIILGGVAVIGIGIVATALLTRKKG